MLVCASEDQYSIQSLPSEESTNWKPISGETRHTPCSQIANLTLYPRQSSLSLLSFGRLFTEGLSKFCERVEKP